MFAFTCPVNRRGAQASPRGRVGPGRPGGWRLLRGQRSRPARPALLLAAVLAMAVPMLTFIGGDADRAYKQLRGIPAHRDSWVTAMRRSMTGHLALNDGDVEAAAFQALPSDVEIRFSTVPTKIDQYDGRVSVTLTNTTEGTVSTEDFDLVVGADVLY